MRATWGLFFWPYWIIATTVSFLGAELYALFTNQQNTLSDYSWGQLHVYGGEHVLLHSAAWWISLLIVVTGMVLLVIHIWFKGI